MDLHRPNRPRGSRSLLTLAAALLALMGLFAAACGDDDGGDDGAGDGGGEASGLLERARSEGITIGIANERPYGYEEGGEATGEAPELAREILSRMDIDEVDFEVVEFGALINGLNARRFDMIAAGMFINPERAGQVAFADPDYCATTAFAVPEGNPEGLTDFQSVIDSGVTLGVLAGAVEAGYATGAGVPDAQISSFQETPDLFDALTAGRIDAATLTAITVREQVEGLDGYEATEGFVPVVDGEEQLGCGAFAFHRDDADFRDAFNEVLNEMKANDEILPIIEEFGFTSAEVDAAKDVSVEDLAG
jgi:polar amino acid transport system substrate-binding protein